MLSVGQLTRITVELMLGAPPSNTSPEALEARAVKALDLAEMRKQGLTPLLLDDFDVDLPPLPSTPSTSLNAEEIQRVNIRFNLGCSMDLARAFEREDREIAEERAQVFQELEGRIEAAQPLSAAMRAQFLEEIERLLAQKMMWPNKAKWLKQVVRGPLAPKKRKRE